jgi:hypothetical protein
MVPPNAHAARRPPCTAKALHSKRWSNFDADDRVADCGTATGELGFDERRPNSDRDEVAGARDDG